MKKSFYLILILVFSCSMIFAQKSINSYKYILVPKQYEFQKSPDKYQVNSLTKFLFDKAGFIALHTDESYPEDLVRNGCLALRAIIEDNSGFFSTKVKIKLVDCRNTSVYTTKEGRSREKDYRKAYHEAIRKSFVEFEELNYTYVEPVNNVIEKVVVSEDKTTIKEPAVVINEAIANSESTEKEINPVIEVEIKSVKEKEINPIVTKEVEKNKSKKLIITTLEGSYFMDKWGICAISKKDNYYTVVGGDENFEFATIYKTSKPQVYIIKWAAYKQPQLLESNSIGNLEIDTENGVRIYKRSN